MTKDLRLDRRDLFTLTTAMALGSALPWATRADAAVAKPATPQPRVEDFATPLVDMIDLLPDGTQVAAITQAGDVKYLATFNVDGSNIRRVTLGGKKIRELIWLDNQHAAVTRSMTTSLPEFGDHLGEYFSTDIIDTTTGDTRVLFSNQNGSAATGSILGGTGRFYPIVFGTWRIKTNGKYRLAAANYRLLQTFNLCVYSFGPESDVGKLIMEGTTFTESFAVGPEGEVVAFSEYQDDNGQKEWRLRFGVRNGNGPMLYKPVHTHKGAPLDNPSLVGIGHDGKSVVIEISDSTTHEASYHEIGASGVLGPDLGPPDRDQDYYPIFHPVTRRLCGFASLDDWYKVYYNDPVLQKIDDAAQALVGEGYRASIQAWGEDVRKVIIRSEGPDDAGTYYYADFADGTTIQIASDYPALPTEWITQKTAVSYKAADGLTIHGYLTLPPFRVAKNLPLVVLPHGGPQARDTIAFDWQVQCLASQGYAVLQPNFRGSSGYGEAFTRAGYGEWGRKMQTDLSDGVRWLASQGTIDPKRVAILGASYGGYAALAGATLDPGVYTCAISIAGPSDLKKMLDWQKNKDGGFESATLIYWHQFMGDPSGYAAISPATNAEKASCPILLIHGTDDTVVPISQSRIMESSLKSAGKPVEFVTYKGQDHWETVGSSRVAMMKAALEFLLRHNPPDAIPA